MTVYRIAKEQYIKDLSGKGAELAGGRWNEKGIPALYVSSSLALCICEILVHSDRDIPPYNMWYAEIEVLERFVSEDLFNSTAFNCAIGNGTDWLKSRASLATKIPSAILPKGYREDFNILINPLHPDFSQIKLKKIEPCPFDGRFFI